MRNYLLLILSTGALLLLFMSTNTVQAQDGIDFPMIESIDDLSPDEIEGLKLMREEEKLAYEVYIKMYEKWGHNVFNNISQAEERHTGFVKEILDAYNIEDPYQEGFANYSSIKLSTLYSDLVEQGSVSLIEAFKVGALIEDLDIADLDGLLIKTDKKDIKEMYENLNRGSRNHMRAFMRQLEMNDVVYSPQFISDDRMTEILNGDHEQGNCDEFGQGKQNRNKSCVNNTKGCNNKKGKQGKMNNRQMKQGKNGKVKCGSKAKSCKSTCGSKK